MHRLYTRKAAALGSTPVDSTDFLRAERPHKKKHNTEMNTSRSPDNHQVVKHHSEVEDVHVVTETEEVKYAEPSMNLPDSEKMDRKKASDRKKKASEKKRKRKHSMEMNTSKTPDNHQVEKLKSKVEHDHVVTTTEEVKFAEHSMKLPDSEKMDMKKTSKRQKKHKQKKTMEIVASETPEDHQVEKLRAEAEHGHATYTEEVKHAEPSMILHDSERMDRKKKTSDRKKKTSNPITCIESSSIEKMRKRKKTMEINLTKTPDNHQDEKVQSEAEHGHVVTDAEEVKYVEPSMTLPDSEKMDRKKKKISPPPAACIESTSLDKCAEVVSHKQEAKCVEPSHHLPDSKKRKSKKKKKKHTSYPSHITCTESSGIDKSMENNINKDIINDLLPNSKLETKDGTYIETDNAVKGVKSRRFCDSRDKDVTGVSHKNDNHANVKSFTYDSSGKKPLISDVSLSNEVEGRNSEQTQKKKCRLHDSKVDSGDGLPSHMQTIHNDSMEMTSMQPETFPRLQEVERIYSRRRKGKDHSEDFENNSSSFPEHQVEFSSNHEFLKDKSEPADVIPEKPKVKFKYSKRERRQKHENRGHKCEHVLVDLSKSQLEVASSQALSVSDCEAVSTSERPKIPSQVLRINVIGDNFVCNQQTGQEDQSSDGVKEEASSENALLAISGSEGRMYAHKVGVHGLIVNEDIISEKQLSDKDDAVKDGFQVSPTCMTIDLTSVEGMVTPISSVEYCNSLNNSIEENDVILDKLRKQDGAARKDVMPVEKSLVPVRKKLLVLDLNGLLVDILYVSNITDRPYRRISGKSAFKRPFCDQFLDFCFEAFDIGVWSSRMKYNVDAVVDYVMGDRKKRLLFSWDQSKCTKTSYKTIENSHKPLVLKELTKLWDKEHLPWEKGEYTPSNTLLIDDSPYKAICNPPHTAIFPLPYRYDNELDDSLGHGGDIRTYLEGLAGAYDVQEYVKEHPFGQPSINEDHPSWKFYIQIIEEVKSLHHAAQN